MTGDWRDDPGQWQHVRALSLDDAQALVLHNWLYTLKELDALGPEHQAVVSVLWSIEGQLDIQLVAPFKPDYLELLAEAKAEVLRKWNGDEMPIPEDGLGAMEQPRAADFWSTGIPRNSWLAGWRTCWVSTRWRLRFPAI